ncbi:MAG: hypothetical protein AB7S75_09775, partial [Desulfococcaceae bacterium]
QKFPSPGGRGQGRGIISDVFTLPLPLPQGRGDLINGFDPLPDYLRLPYKNQKVNLFHCHSGKSRNPLFSASSGY